MHFGSHVTVNARRQQLSPAALGLWMQFDSEPDGIRLRIVSMERVLPFVATHNATERVVCVADRHYNIFVDRALISRRELLHAPHAMNLRVHFEERVFVMNEAIGIAG